MFETGRPVGDYGKVTLLAGDRGHLTYGRSQTTLASGNLFRLIRAYCLRPEAAFGATLGSYLDRLADIDLGLDRDVPFRRLLGQAGGDPIMRAVQDAFFDRVYWQPAVRSAAFIGSVTPLGMAVVYDSRVHGSWHAMRDRTNARFGRLADLREPRWMACYLRVRRAWLANHANAVLNRTVYRMDALKGLVDAGNWDLDLPFRVCGRQIDEPVLAGAPVRASAAPRLLRRRTPVMRGRDVRALQQALAGNGMAIDPDGRFGPATEAAVIAFQERENLRPDGIVGPATRSRLEIDVVPAGRSIPARSRSAAPSSGRGATIAASTAAPG